MNRVVQRMKYCGGTFSGPKTFLCVEEMMVVGHLCTYEGRKIEPDRAGVISHWGPCQHLTDVRAFLGTCGVCQKFIRDYSKIAEPLVKLTRLNVPFEWEAEQQLAMDKLKHAVVTSLAI